MSYVLQNKRNYGNPKYQDKKKIAAGFYCAYVLVVLPG